MQITIEMIETKEFKTKPRGYDQQEVDEFLDAICDEMARQLNEIQSLQQQLMSAQKAARPAAQVNAATTVVKPVTAFAAPAQPAPVNKETEDSFREILEMAQKVKDETIATAKKQAEEIKQKAQQEADAQLSGLVQEKADLTRQVSGLKNAAADYRAKFEALLQAQQEAMEKAADLF